MSALGPYSGNSFQEYARTQHELAVELARRHIPEATGCCRACGRVFPCDGHQAGLHLRAHYESYLDPPALPAPTVGGRIADAMGSP
jgi:hypothetical protein